MFSQVYWKDRIILTFQNLRRRRDSQQAQVVERKGKTSKQSSDSQTASKNIEYGFLNYRPMERPLSESAQTIEEHRKVFP